MAATGRSRNTRSPGTQPCGQGVTPIKVRALHRAVAVSGEPSPFDTLSLKVYYPCRFTDSVEQRRTGVVAADDSRAPFPVVVLLPAEDVSHESYGWIATELALAGFAVATYSWIRRDKERGVHSTPGLQRKRLGKKRFGRKPSCPALPAVFSELKRLNKHGVLANTLNLSRTVLGGHGLGGSLALLNANKDWFPAVCAAFSYAGHCLADPEQGWDKRTVLPLAADLPLLMIGGTQDSLLESETGHLAGKHASPTWALEHSFAEGIKGKRSDRHLVLLEGGSHYTFASPRDETTGRHFLDRRSRGLGKSLRKYLASLVVTFCDQACCGDPMSTADLKALADGDHPMVAQAQTK